jgi:hypothetical protein
MERDAAFRQFVEELEAETIQATPGATARSQARSQPRGSVHRSREVVDCLRANLGVIQVDGTSLGLRYRSPASRHFHGRTSVDAYRRKLANQCGATLASAPSPILGALPKSVKATASPNPFRPRARPRCCRWLAHRRYGLRHSDPDGGVCREPHTPRARTVSGGAVSRRQRTAERGRRLQFLEPSDSA